MRIEIQIGSEEPNVYVLKDKLLLGSGEACQIKLPQSLGISRKHLQITLEGDEVFLTDMGSTNGTFINEERLAPGVKEHFTTFFPARLGDSVTVTLHTDDGSPVRLKVPTPAPQPKKESTGTRTVTIGEVTNKGGTKTKTKLPEKKATASVKKPQAKEKGLSDSSRMRMTFILIAVLAGGPLIYNYLTSEEPVAEPPPVTESRPVTPAAPTAPAEEKIELVPTEGAPSLEKIQLALADFKCTTETEKALCQVVPDAFSSPGGVITNVDHILFIVPEEKWFLESFKFSNPNVRDKLRLNAEERTIFFAAILFQALGAYEWEKLEKNLFFAFYRTKDQQHSVSSLVAVTPKELVALRKAFPEDMVKLISTSRAGILEIRRYKERMRVFKPTETTEEPVIPPPQTQPQENPPATTPAPAAAPQSGV